MEAAGRQFQPANPDTNAYLNKQGRYTPKLTSIPPTPVPSMRQDPLMEGILGAPAVPMPGKGYLDNLTTNLNKQHREARKATNQRSNYDIIMESIAKANAEKVQSDSNSGKKPTTPPVDVLADVVKMDQLEYEQSRVADLLGKERASSRKLQNHEGLQPCHRKPCSWGYKCRYLHIPLGKDNNKINKGSILSFFRSHI